MFTTEQLNEIQAKVRKMESEARKALSTLGDRAQAELKDLFTLAEVSSKEQLNQLGKELVRLGQKLQDVARDPAVAKAAEAAASGVQPPESTVN
jgi:hypothetical protein